MASGFKDHFSARSDNYARYRPMYPAALFEYLAAQCEEQRKAWDCATGSGQAAIALAAHFDHVYATDASADQVQNAIAHEGVEYAVAAAEAPQLEADSIDLVTVGQALHWFDQPRFFSAAAQALVDGGVLAAWCYETCTVSESVDALIVRLYDDIVGPFWPPERALIERGYADIELPGNALETPAFDMRLAWRADDMLGYLGTWSACKRYAAEHGEDPVSLIAAPLEEAWGNEPRNVRWPLTLRASRL